MERLVDFSRPYKELDWYKKGESKIDPESQGADWIEQDGLLFCWSESHCSYDLAWWLYTDKITPLVKYLNETRKPPVTQGES